MLTLEKIDVTVYGLKPNPDHGLEDLQALWNSRTNNSYHPIPLEELESSLWRNARSGKIQRWHSGMISNTIKKQSPVVEDWININSLPVMTQEKLALEQITRYKQSIIAVYRTMMRGQSDGESLIKAFGDLLQEITCYPSDFDIERNLSEVVDLMPDIKSKLGEPEVLIQFEELIEKYRFEQLDALIQGSEWVENCLQIQEIYERKLFRFKAGSFEQYCKTSNISGGMRRVKIGTVINQLKSANLPLPKNRGQAAALSEIPTENRTKVWQVVLESDEKITAKFIEKAHQSLLNLPPANSKRIFEITDILARISALEKYHSELGSPVNQFLEKIQARTQGTELEAKMLRLILNHLQEFAKSDSPQLPFADD